MKECIQCGGLINDGAKFCGYCGAVQDADLPVKSQQTAGNNQIDNALNHVSVSSAKTTFAGTTPKRINKRPNELENFSDGIYGNNKNPQRLKSGNGLGTLAVLALITAVILLFFLAADRFGSSYSEMTAIVMQQII